MKKILLLITLSLTIACNNDLNLSPSNIATAGSLTDFQGVLNAAYYYQIGSVTPMAVMGDFRADNAKMQEGTYRAFDTFGNNDLLNMGTQFFEPFYIALYKSILSANNVIENSDNATHVGEAKFLRALSYFKLVRVFGDVTVNLTAGSVSEDESALKRKPAAEVYDNVIIPDLKAAISALDNSNISSGKASKIAAQGLLGKVYMQRSDFANAETYLAMVINDATAAKVELQKDFDEIFGSANNLNSEILFATQMSATITDEYNFTEFVGWYLGSDTKSLEPLDLDLDAAFDAAGDVTRKNLTVDNVKVRGIKYISEDADQDWIELRLADIILLHAEALNETGSTPEAVLDILDPIRVRAGLPVLDHATVDTQAKVRQAIQDERRLELAFEGQRWFDLVRTGTVDAEMGQTINPNYHLFPLPLSEVIVSDQITQNAGY